MKIYVVGSSKNRFLPLDNIREKYLVDAEHDGDNIDSLNPWYCELTGLYYLWKHCEDDIVGLEHYRRYFVNSQYKLLSETEIKTLLSTHDIICIYSPYDKAPVITWINSHNMRGYFERFLRFSKQYIGNDFYTAGWKILNGNYHCLGNMFIGKKELIDEYCEMIFDLLEKFILCEQSYNRRLPYRICGYFTEFLFAAWLELKHKKVFWNMYTLVR